MGTTLTQSCLLLSLFTCECSVFETGSYYVVQAGLELVAILPQLPECWDCRHALGPGRVFGLWCGVHARSVTTKPHLQPHMDF